DLLAVGTDVLDRGGPDRARDPGQRLDADPAALDGQSHERLPRLPGSDGDDDATAGRVVAFVLSRDTRRGDLDDGAGEPLVGDDDVAAAGEHQDRLALLVGTSYGIDEVGLRGRAHPGAGRTSEPESRVVAESFVANLSHAGPPWGCRARCPRRR